MNTDQFKAIWNAADTAGDTRTAEALSLAIANEGPMLPEDIDALRSFAAVLARRGEFTLAVVLDELAADRSTTSDHRASERA